MEIIYINILGIEALAFAISCLILIQRAQQLTSYLSTTHPRFLEEHLSAPFWAGDRTVMRQHLRAIKNAYFAQMPDEKSEYLQSRMRSYAVVCLSLFLVFAVTLIAGAIFFISMRDVRSP